MRALCGRARGAERAGEGRRPRRGAETPAQKPAQREADDEVSEDERDRRGEQPRLKIELAGLAVDAPLDALRRRAERLQLAEARRQVERPARAAGAIEAGRMRRADGCLGEARGGDAAARRRRPAEPAEAVERLHRRERAVLEPRAHALAQADEAVHHLDEQPRQREVRPRRVGRRVHEHEPPAAAPLGGHERRAVGERRPRLRREIERRLGEHLAAHADVVGHLEPGERRVGLEGRERGRLAPRQRAAEDAIAAAQRDRHELVGALGDVRAGEADEHAALGEPALERRALVADHLGDIGEHEHGERALEELADRAPADLAERRERALEVVELRQQRLVGLDRAGRDEADGPAAPALVEEDDGAGATLALDLDADDFIAQLRRRLDVGAGATLAVGEADGHAREDRAVLALGAKPQPRLAVSARTQRLEAQRAGAVGGRTQRARAVARGIGPHAHRPELGESGGEALGGAPIEAVRQPHDVGAARDVELRNRRARGRAVGAPGLRLERLDARARLGRAHQAARRDRAVRLGRRRHQADVALGAFGPLEHLRERGLAALPTACGGPAVVDDDDERAVALERCARVDQRMREADDDEGGRDQPERDQPRRRLRGRLLLAPQPEQQPHGGEGDALRCRRRYPQQPPDHRQHGERGEQPRRGEDEHLEPRHDRPLPRGSRRHRHRRIQREQRLLRRAVRVVDGEAPARGARERGERLAVRGEARHVVAAQ